MNDTERNTVGGRPIVQCTSPSRSLMDESMLFVHFFCHLLALHPWRWVGGSDKVMRVHTSHNFVFELSHIWQVTGGVVLSKGSSAVLKTGTPSRAHRQLSSFGRGSHRLWGWSRLCVCVCVCVFSALPPVCVAILRLFLSLVSG